VREQPLGAQVLIHVLNSRELPWRSDQLVAPEVAKDFFHGSALAFDDHAIEVSTLAMLRTVRDGLVDVVANLASADRARVSWEAITAVSQSMCLNVCFRQAVDGATATLSPSPGMAAADAVVGRLLTHLFDTVRNESLRRIKLCPNPECGIAFFDQTRSRTQRWHSYNVCGNVVNVAAYRSRKRDR
jgi:predicted RNA-binding Zn ribbon-like protein